MVLWLISHVDLKEYYLDLNQQLAILKETGFTTMEFLHVLVKKYTFISKNGHIALQNITN